ncbi:MAG: hypothetical protein ABH950_00300 [Candidatus Altiarchaeota archaeon]
MQTSLEKIHRGDNNMTAYSLAISTGHIWKCENCGYQSQLIYQEHTQEYACGTCGSDFKLTKAEKKKHF